MAIINETIVRKLNEELKQKGCGFEYSLMDNDSPSPAIRRVVVDKVGFVTSSVINCTKTFYEWLDKWFIDNYGIELTYNNTGEICWSKDFETTT